MRQLTPKPLFASSTVRGATASAIATLIIGILPFAQNIANRHCKEDQICLEDTNDIVEIISLVVTTIGLGSAGYAVAGRASIGDLWTPKGVPGPTREELLQENQDEDDVDQRLGGNWENFPQTRPTDFMSSTLLNGQRRLVTVETTFDNPEEGI